MKKVLILGGSHRDIPLIQAAKELGYFVCTLGKYESYLGHKYADKAYLEDFNNLDAVRKIYAQESIDYLIPGCGEESYLNTVQLSQELSIGNFDDLAVAQLVHNKWRFKEFCLENGISTPNGFHLEKSIKNLHFPIVVKPTNLSGGRGVTVVQNPIALQEAVSASQHYSDEIFLEEYIEGQLIAYSVFLQNQKILYAFCGVDETYLNKYLISSAYPFQLQNTPKERLEKDIEKLSSKLQLVDGMFHLQVIIKNSTPYIIDVSRRIPGDFYPSLIEYTDHVKYSQAVVKAYIGEALNGEFSREDESDFIIRHVVMPNKNGIYQELSIDATIKESIVFQFDLLTKGTKIQNYLNTQITILLIHCKNENEGIIKNLNTLVYPIVEEEKIVK